MNNILKYGCYCIGSLSTSVCHNLHEVIHLSLEERDQRLVKKNYNLEELRDLESKLVLITGSKADHRKKVDYFLDVSFVQATRDRTNVVVDSSTVKVCCIKIA